MADILARCRIVEQLSDRSFVEGSRLMRREERLSATKQLLGPPSSFRS